MNPLRIRHLYTVQVDLSPSDPNSRENELFWFARFLKTSSINDVKHPIPLQAMANRL
jgi:hypothetical protein